MKTFELAAATPQAEFKLLKELYDAYIDNPWEMVACKIKTPFGNFTNRGGFNGNPSDLWLYKDGTKGQQFKTFWRTSFGSKRGGFKVFIYDLRTVKVSRDNAEEIAENIGANIIEISGLKYFTIK